MRPSLTSTSARGEYMLNWMEEGSLTAPDQQMGKATYFPYNHRMQPRRLDYLLLKHLDGLSGIVLQQRDLASSDHEPVSVMLASPIPKRTGKQTPHPWGVRRLRQSAVKMILKDSNPHQQGDPLQQLTDVAIKLTEPGRQLPKFVETAELKQARREALQQPPGLERRAMWKAVNREHSRQLRQWRGNMNRDAACGYWSSKRALERRTHDRSWELNLVDDDNGRDHLKQHFKNIFRKQDRNKVDGAPQPVPGMQTLQMATFRTQRTPSSPETVERRQSVWNGHGLTRSSEDPHPGREMAAEAPEPLQRHVLHLPHP